MNQANEALQTGLGTAGQKVQETATMSQNADISTARPECPRFSVLCSL